MGKTILRQQRQKKTVALPPNGSSAGQGQGAPLKSYGNALLQVFSIRHQPHQVKLDLIEKALMGERREDRKMGGGEEGDCHAYPLGGFVSHLFVTVNYRTFLLNLEAVLAFFGFVLSILENSMSYDPIYSHNILSM